MSLFLLFFLYFGEFRGHVSRILESYEFELEGSLKSHLVQLSYNEQGHLQLDQDAQSPSSLTLGVSRDGASTISLGSLCLTTLIVRNFLCFCFRTGIVFVLTPNFSLQTS